MASHTTEADEPLRVGADSAFDRLLDLTRPISSVLLLFLSLLLIIDITYGIFWPGAGFFITNRLAMIILVWITFLTIALHARDDEHIRVKYFYRMFPDRAKRVFDISETFLNLLFAGMITYGTISVISSVYLNTTAEGIPIVLAYLPLLICMILLIGVFGRQLLVILELDGFLSRGGER